MMSKVFLKKNIRVKTEFDEKTKPCSICSKETKSRCSKCKTVSYCGVECQKKDYKTHKKICVIPEEKEGSAMKDPISAYQEIRQKDFAKMVQDMYPLSLRGDLDKFIELDYDKPGYQLRDEEYIKENTTEPDVMLKSFAERKPGHLCILVIKDGEYHYGRASVGSE